MVCRNASLDLRANKSKKAMRKSCRLGYRISHGNRRIYCQSGDRHLAADNPSSTRCQEAVAVVCLVYSVGITVSLHRTRELAHQSKVVCNSVLVDGKLPGGVDRGSSAGEFPADI